MYNHDYYNSIEKKFEILLPSLETRLSESELQEIKKYIDVGEYGLAFEDLCSILQEKALNITATSYKLLDELGSQMLLESNTWKCLEALIQKE